LGWGRKVCEVKSEERKLSGAEAGLTLAEALVVVVVVGILVVAATVSFNRALAHWELVTAARTLVSDLRSARDLAVSEGVQTRVYVDKATTPVCYKIYKWDGSEWKIVNEPKEFTLRLHFPEQYVGSHGLRDCQNDFRFSSSGNALVGYSGTIKLENAVGESRYVIVYATTGRVRASEKPP